MSGDDHGTGELDLDGIEARWVAVKNWLEFERVYSLATEGRHVLVAERVYSLATEDVPALVAEVRRLRAEGRDDRKGST